MFRHRHNWRYYESERVTFRHSKKVMMAMLYKCDKCGEFDIIRAADMEPYLAMLENKIN